MHTMVGWYHAIMVDCLEPLYVTAGC